MLLDSINDHLLFEINFALQAPIYCPQPSLYPLPEAGTENGSASETKSELGGEDRTAYFNIFVPAGHPHFFRRLGGTKIFK